MDKYTTSCVVLLNARINKIQNKDWAFGRDGAVKLWEKKDEFVEQPLALPGCAKYNS